MKVPLGQEAGREKLKRLHRPLQYPESQDRRGGGGCRHISPASSTEIDSALLRILDFCFPLRAAITYKARKMTSRFIINKVILCH